jgi:Uncharacterised protein family (UPF0158)
MVADYSSVAGRERRGTLRSAVFSGDGAGVVGALSTQRWDDALQLAGDGLLIALAQEIEGARELARRCIESVRERDWDGDDLLAEHLEAALGEGPVPLLRPIPVDLDELSSILEGDPELGGGRIDLRTGDVWPQVAIENADGSDDEDDEDDEEAEDRWLAVWPEGSSAGYRDMERFIGTIADDDRIDRLSIAISGRGAFRRFKDVLARWPDELERWYAFSEERRIGRARVWLADAGYVSARA